MPFVHIGNKVYSFCDITKDPVGTYLEKNSVEMHRLSYFFETQDKKNILVWLLNQEVKHAALEKGLKYDNRHKTTYFFPTEDFERTETYEARFRKSTRIVAKRIRISQFSTYLYVHSAASLSFSIIEDKVYLKILPRIVLTADGYSSISGFEKGTVKTRLVYNQYNNAYLNLVLFWASRFKSKERQKIEFGNRILVSPEPVTAKINFGIRNDRPGKEFSRRKDELYSVQSLEVV